MNSYARCVRTQWALRMVLRLVMLLLALLQGFRNTSIQWTRAVIREKIDLLVSFDLEAVSMEVGHGAK